MMKRKVTMSRKISEMFIADKKVTVIKFNLSTDKALVIDDNGNKYTVAFSKLAYSPKATEVLTAKKADKAINLTAEEDLYNPNFL